MRYLLDTTVVSELRPPAAQEVRAWAGAQRTTELGVSVITVVEVEIGVGCLEHRDPSRGQVLRAWLERDLLAAFAGRVLPVDLAVARRAASMHVPDPRLERDALIAATALVHDLVVVTRNTTDLEPLGVPLVDPWDG